MRINRLFMIALALVWAGAATAQMASEKWTSGRPDGHAPIGVMGDHSHGAGEVMLSYRFMSMEMDGLRHGSDVVTPQQVLVDYMVTPTSMPMQMHMIGAMFAPTDRVTLMAMVPYLSMEMDHQTRAGGTFRTSSSGIGDVSLSALVMVYDANRQRVHLNAGASVPTGSVDERDVTPASGGQAVRLPYPMQTGSGTVDLRPGVTYLGQTDWWSWGAQSIATLRVGENDNGYTFGDEILGTAWLARRLNDWWSVSGRLTMTAWGDVEGRDASLNPMMVPTADPGLRGGERLEALAGVNFEVRRGALDGHRVAVEVGAPVYRRLDGPQLERDWQVLIGWQYAFDP